VSTSRPVSQPTWKLHSPRRCPSVATELCFCCRRASTGFRPAAAFSAFSPAFRLFVPRRATAGNTELTSRTWAEQEGSWLKLLLGNRRLANTKSLGAYRLSGSSGGVAMAPATPPTRWRAVGKWRKKKQAVFSRREGASGEQLAGTVFFSFERGGRPGLSKETGGLGRAAGGVRRTQGHGDRRGDSGQRRFGACGSGLPGAPAFANGLRGGEWSARFQLASGRRARHVVEF